MVMLVILRLMPVFDKRNGSFLAGACLAVWAFVFFLDRAGYHSLNLAAYSNILGILGTLNLIVAASILGRALATGLMRPAEFVPVCLVAAATDLASVLAGPTQKIAGILESYYTGPMTTPPPIVDYFLIKTPVWGAPYLMPLFGVSDLVFLVLLSTGAEKFKINDRFLNIPVAGLGLFFGVFMAHSTMLFVPGMPLMVLFFLPVVLFQSPGARKLHRSDIAYSILFPAIIFMGVRLFQF
ncbi:hypothetical protein HRM2_48710 [Desulforapulum autotrophicum HRM2]|uniref:Uncharacterized protein n=1 Tax=Desulforapulum autotrophicum (strain ATCC 43914 / DSM 3382 / VKM B-1955 / HRM2) TaxID=177437 RepID=C0QIH5_DESAH|nr:hypothetical protein [Desulforapulum autotrophicum]ACN17919.1 hypothetical protein HRM2_48710 [Desulforapulum autotrophicum HRM2]